MPGRGPTRPTGRMAAKRVRTARGRPTSSTQWLRRQLNDPYVAEAKKLGYRSRAAFKLLQLDERFGILTQGMRVVDLGAAPGGWTQVALDTVGPSGQVVAVDIAEMPPLGAATVLTLDFLDDAGPDTIRSALGGPADLVLSDMAAPTVGHAATEHLRILALAEAAHLFATEVLAPGGGFVCKLFQGGAQKDLLDALKRDFRQVRHAKPAASRAESSELYLVAQGFRGGAAPATRPIS